MRMLYVAAVLGLSVSQASAQQPWAPNQGQTQFPGYPNTGYQYPNPYGVGGFGTPYQPLNPINVMPNVYNPATQPLSPYLNLLRGGNAGVNYFYGVRPGTVGGGAARGAGAPFVASGGNRATFFPHVAAAPDPLEGNGPEEQGVLPPAGHPVMYNNTMGYFPGPMGQAGAARSALGGLGASSPRSSAPKK